jgi:CDP-diacylglycerol--serine O-phosphatidyltransferase
MRKIYIVPNIVTTANMFCGFYSVLSSIRGDFQMAAWLILFAAVFDMLDGRIARLAKATSQFGVEYDSLSDLVSFGFAPAILLYQWALDPFGRLGALASFLFLACAALRLARFNVTTSTLPKAFFQGVASPIAAGMVATLVIFNQATGLPTEWEPSLFSRENQALVVCFGMSSLMISTLRFPSFKELNWRSRASFGYLMVGVLAMILVAVRPEVTLFLIGLAYVVGGLIYNVVWAFTRGRRPAQNPKGVVNEA